MVDYSLIGKRLKAARSKTGLTQQDMAEKLGLSVPYISRVERGNARLNLRRLSEFCKILNVSEGSILNGVSDSSYDYFYDNFNEILKNCSSEKQQLIYEIAKVISESEV